MPPRLGPILFSMIYDSLLMTGLAFVAAFPVVVISGGEQVSREAGFRLYLAAVIAAYFILSWCLGGQTVGMKAWRLRLVSASGGPVTVSAACLRCLAALVSAAALGLGWLWVLVDGERRSWHDRLSATRLERTEKRPGS
ncbi:MAG: RDD family protein [Gammaproteobacteria bacterium]|nr:RDD family protein [Gammaproteobacteria bacterium]NNM01448.1 RDD family protein [Gammaproteobacteria bacterium]